MAAYVVSSTAQVDGTGRPGVVQDAGPSCRVAAATMPEGSVPADDQRPLRHTGEPLGHHHRRGGVELGHLHVVEPLGEDPATRVDGTRLARYLADYKTAKPMTDTEADKFFSAQGWSEERLIYITVKIAVGLDVLQNGDNSPLLQNVPKIMFPTKAERKLIKAHSAEIEEIFIVGH